MLQKLPLNNFEWIKDTLGQFLEVDIQYLKNFLTFTMIHNFYLKEWKVKKSKSL